MTTDDRSGMNENRHPSAGANEPLPYPTHKLLGIIDDEARAWQAVDALVASGVSASDIELFHGEEGAERLSLTAQGKGLTAWLTRALHSFGGDQEVIREDEADLASGRFLVALPAASEEDRKRATEILTQHGGRRIRYYGVGAFETLVP